jgi:spermidine/putrescine transport system permease protein
MRLGPGRAAALPVLLFLAAGFVAPLVAVAAYSLATPRSFDVFRSFTLDNYGTILSPANTVWMSFAWSLGLAGLTVLALGLLFVFPLFISENVRLYGWVLFLIKGGVLDGTLRTLLGIEAPDVLFRPGAILFGMIYVYLPFMLFPMTLGLAMVPRDLLDAARDLGASRWQVWREVELPLAMPGILIGLLLTFVLAAGAVAEAKVLGGQSVIVITHDIEIAFTYAQNWPLGSALAVLMMVIVGAVALAAIARLDLDRVLGRR